VLTRRLWKPIVTANAPPPAGYYSQGAVAPAGGRFIFTSGHNSRDAQTGEILHVGDVAAQTRETIKHIEAILAEAGADLSDVVKVTVLYRNVGDIPAVAAVRRELFPHDPPCSTGYGVELAHGDLLIEIDAIAVVGGEFS
jgi:2-iminobutanoate/2-iminopropanoate deaminase